MLFILTTSEQREYLLVAFISSITSFLCRISPAGKWLK